MSTRRPGRDENYNQDDRGCESVVLATGTIQTTDHGLASSGRSSAHPDERVSLFWRVFGGTILSIIALIGITIYNNQASSIAELRAEVSRLNEARSEMVKKEEFNSRNQNMWDRVQQLQEMRVTVTGLKEQLSSVSEKTAELKVVIDKLTVLEQRLKASEEDHKALAKAELSITALEQKAIARDSQMKTIDDDRKEMVKQLQELRERLAKVEGMTETKPMPKMPASKKD